MFLLDFPGLPGEEEAANEEVNVVANVVWEQLMS